METGYVYSAGRGYPPEAIEMSKKALDVAAELGAYDVLALARTGRV